MLPTGKEKRGLAQEGNAFESFRGLGKRAGKRVARICIMRSLFEQVLEFVNFCILIRTSDHFLKAINSDPQAFTKCLVTTGSAKHGSPARSPLLVSFSLSPVVTTHNRFANCR